MSIVIEGNEYVVVPLAKRGKPIKKSLAKEIFQTNRTAWRGDLGGSPRQILHRLRNAPEYQIGCYGRASGSKDKWEFLGVMMTRKINIKKLMIDGKEVFAGMPETYREATGDYEFKGHKRWGNALLCVSVVNSKLKEHERFRLDLVPSLLAFGAYINGKGSFFQRAVRNVDIIAFSRTVQKYLERKGKVPQGLTPFEYVLGTNFDPIIHKYHAGSSEFKPPAEVANILVEGKVVPAIFPHGRLEDLDSSANVAMHYRDGKVKEWLKTTARKDLRKNLFAK